MTSLLRSLIPASARFALRKWRQERQRERKTPQMLWGYLDPSGVWRANTRISDTVFIYHPEKVAIADNVFVWHYSILDGTGTIEIDEGAQIGAWVGIFTHSSHIAIRLYGSHYSEVPESEKKGYQTKKVTVGRYAFIGAGAKIMPGSTIGNGALVSAGAIVSGVVSDYQIVSGSPAIEVGDTRKLDARYLRDPQIERWYAEWQK